MINKVLSLKDNFLKVVAESLLSDSEKSVFLSLMSERMNILS